MWASSSATCSSSHTRQGQTWELGAADQEGMSPCESPIEDCFTPRKRKVADEGVGSCEAAAVHSPPTPPAASQDTIGAASDAIPETEESKDAPRSVLSLSHDSNEPATELGLIKPVSRLGCCLCPNLDASREKIAPINIGVTTTTIPFYQYAIKNKISL
jgi:hypothetical protein